jgi:hypothetical protein
MIGGGVAHGVNVGKGRHEFESRETRSARENAVTATRKPSLIE